MTLKRKEFPQLSTESGQIGWSMGLWLLLFLGVLLSTCLQVDVYKATARYLEDALAASNLAAAVQTAVSDRAAPWRASRSGGSSGR